MPPATVTMAALANRMLNNPDFTRIAVLTTETTGNPTLFGLAIDRPRELTILQYVDDESSDRARHHVSMSLADLATHIDRHNLAGHFDMLVADPFHTYRSSRACLGLGLSLLRAGGIALVHDCLPPVALTSPTYVSGEWCGVTFAAFRDLCHEHDLNWCTIDDDFGVGVAIVDEVVVRSTPLFDEREHVGSKDLDLVLAEYRADPIRVMQGVDPRFASEAVERVRRGLSVEDLSPDPSRSTRHSATHSTGQTDTIDDTAEVARLRAALDDCAMSLSELQNRPSQQLKAFARTLPQAISVRLGGSLRPGPDRPKGSPQ